MKKLLSALSLVAVVLSVAMEFISALKGIMAIWAVNVGRMAFEEQLSEMRTAMIFLIIGIVCFIAAAVLFIVGKVKKGDSKA